MKNKITKGRWEVCYGSSAHMKGTIIVCKHQEIAGVWKEADAHFIVLAPRLYQALQNILDQACENGCPRFTNIRTGMEKVTHSQACKAARKLLALIEKDCAK